MGFRKGTGLMGVIADSQHVWDRLKTTLSCGEASVRELRFVCHSETRHRSLSPKISALAASALKEASSSSVKVLCSSSGSLHVRKCVSSCAHQ